MQKATHRGSRQHAWPHLVLHQQRALRRVGKMSSSPLDHQLKGGVRLNIGQILFPQNGARAALDAKELQDKRSLGSQLERN